MKHEIESDTADVHWYEGMFLLPHHYQTARRRNFSVDQEKLSYTQPWCWGFSDLQINPTALVSNRIKVDRAVLRLKGGTWLNIPDNAYAMETSFEEHLEAISDSLAVWFAVRRPEPHQPVVHSLGEEHKGNPRTFVLRENQVADENNGKNEQPVQSRLWNVQIFFGSPPADQYESICIGKLVWSSAKKPVFALDHIPPIQNISASTLLKDRTKNLVVKLNNQAAFLKGELEAKRIALTSDPLRVLSNLMRLQVSSGYGLVLQQILNVDQTHPYQLYLHLLKLAGEMVALHPEAQLDLPSYDHDNLAKVMTSLLKTIENMIEGGVVVDYIHRPFEIDGNQRYCRLDSGWLDPPQGTDVTGYVCIVSDMPEEQVNQMLSDYRVKIGPPSKIEELLISRIRGISLQRLRRIPAGLPDKSGLHYFQIDFSRNSEFWNDLFQDLSVMIYGIPVEATPEISLYVHVEQRGR